MDVSLTSLKTAFEDVAYQYEMRSFKLFMFVLVTPADPVEFKTLLQGFTDIHYLTGEDVLIVAPSIRVNGEKVSRDRLAAELESNYYESGHFRQTYINFKEKQTAETYAFSKYIGLPFNALPCLAFFDRLVSPDEFVAVPFGSRSDLQLAQQLRQVMTHIADRCLWATKGRISELQDEVAKRLPSAVARNKSLLQGISNDELALGSLLKRESSLATHPAVSTQEYSASLGNLTAHLEPFAASKEPTHTSDDVSEMLARFHSGSYDSWAFQHLHNWRSKNRQRISTEMFQAVHDFFRVAHAFFRKERLETATAHIRDSLSKKLAIRDEAILQEKQHLSEELDELRAEVTLAAVAPLQAISEIGGARRFECARQRLDRDGVWKVQASDLTQLRLDGPKETAVVKSSMPHIVDGRLESFDHTTIDVVVLTAVRVELEAVLRELAPRVGMTQIVRVTDARTRRIYYLGRLGKANVAVTMCRMGSSGRAASLLVTYKAILAWRPRYVIMVGIAFGRDSAKQQLGDVLVSSIVHCYELQRIGGGISINRGPSPECGELLLAAFENVLDWKFPVHEGKESQIRVGAVLSGEKLVDNSDFKNQLFDAYPGSIGGEMEAAGVYAAASTEATEWIVVKGICDWADGTKTDNYQTIASNAAVSLVKHVLNGNALLQHE